MGEQSPAGFSRSKVKSSMKSRQSGITLAAVIGGIILILVLVFGTIWMGNSAGKDTESAVRSVSQLYLTELAGRREQVVAGNLQDKIGVIKTALDLMTEEDRSDSEHLQAYQARIKTLFRLERFAFVGADDLIYTSAGPQNEIGQYHISFHELTGPKINVETLEGHEKKVIIAVPVSVRFQETELIACFMQIDMKEMLAGVSMDAQKDSTTFSNLYDHQGVALSDTVLGGLAVEDNLLEAMRNAVFDPGYSYEAFLREFSGGKRGTACFTYNGIPETLSFVPVEGTEWQLTYLIRESVIRDSIRTVTGRTIRRSVVQSGLTALVLLGLFAFIFRQTRKNNALVLAKEKSDAENRARQEEMEQKLRLQEELLARKQDLQDALAAAEAANKAKTVFLSNMSHEIRTPMNAIIGLDNIALNDPDISDRTRDHLQKIGQSAHHLLGIINDILDMSRIESGRMIVKHEEFSFSRMLEQVNTIISGQCRDKGLHYECRTFGQIDQYYIGDDMKLRQVMINILGNAVKFTPEGGSVTLQIENVARNEGRSTLRFTFSDTGIGMSQEYLPKIFDAFSQEDSSSTTKYGSTGLGMPITKSIVELMNGHIEVESEKGKGTTFTVTLTLTEAGRGDQEANAVEIRPDEMRVLVIDDDRIACDHAQLILGQIGVGCDTVLSGRDAVETVRMRHARREDYNLILVDWKMPEMDGIETTRQIREIVGSHTPVIILTSYDWADVEEEAREAGVDTFVAKPLFAGTVMDEFREAFRKKNAKLAEKTVSLAGRRVLLAEDVAVNAEIMMMVLSMREMQADHAENGRIAVEMFQSHEPGYYDAILMDMRMPEMDGLEATRRIREMDRPDAKTIPMIALTANAFDEDVQRSMQAGLNAHLSKPVEPELLFETLAGLIHD